MQEEASPFDIAAQRQADYGRMFEVYRASVNEPTIAALLRSMPIRGMPTTESGAPIDLSLVKQTSVEERREMTPSRALTHRLIETLIVMIERQTAAERRDNLPNLGIHSPALSSRMNLEGSPRTVAHNIVSTIQEDSFAQMLFYDGMLHSNPTIFDGFQTASGITLSELVRNANLVVQSKLAG